MLSPLSNSLHVQDAMREHCLDDLAQVWYNLVITYSEAEPDLAETVLAAVKRYVPWIDIGLVANDRCARDTYVAAVDH